MALWLELIPRLHKSDQLNTRYHQLDNYENLSTFEDQEFTRQTNAAMLWQDEIAFHSATSDYDVRQSTNALTYQPFPRRSTSLSRRHQNRSTAPPPPPQPKVVLQASTKQTNARPDAAESFKTVTSNTLSLSVTVGVGCALFLLNLLIFAVLYYQKDRMRRELRLHCAGELSLLKKDQELIAQQTYRLRCGSALADADSNGDATTLAPPAGPPPPPLSTSTRHQLVAPQEGTSSLQRRTSPIPVAVPEAPYAVITSSSTTMTTTSTTTTTSSSSSSFCSAAAPPARCHTAPSSSTASSSNHVGCHAIKYLPLNIDENNSNSFNTSTSV